MPLFLPSTMPPLRADELRRVRLDRRRIVELAGHGPALAARTGSRRSAASTARARSPKLRARAPRTLAQPVEAQVRRDAVQASSASATSPMLALPARSPMPLIVPDPGAPARTAASAAAVARPKSLWPCKCTGTPGPSHSFVRPRSSATASGLARRSCPRRRPPCAPASIAVSVDRFEVADVRAGPVDAEESDGDPCSTAYETAVAIR